MQVKLTRYTHEPVAAIEEAASNCYNSAPDSNGRIMNACYDSSHLSPFEFVNFTWHISGVSRALLAQLTRHRHMSFAVRSQRYVDESGFSYVTPPSIMIDEHALHTYNYAISVIQKAYNYLIDTGTPKEDARFLLPNACKTTLECSMNLRELIHFCNERLCKKSQWEIQQLAKKMTHEVIKVMPEANKYLVPKCEAKAPFCFCTEQKSCGKHPRLQDIFERANLNGPN